MKSIVRRPHLWRGVIVAILALVMHTPQAKAAQIQFSATQNGGTQWQYGYTISNNDLPSVGEFTIWFSRGLYTSINVIASPADWDSIVVQPDDQLPADGFFDSLQRGSGLKTGGSAGAFIVSFIFLGSGSPGSQPFEIIDPDTFSTIQSGNTVPAATEAPDSVSIPEPGVVGLILLGALLLGVPRLWRTRLPTGRRNLRPNGQTHPSFRSTGIACIAFASAASSALAAPRVEGYELASSVRTGRTTFNLSYRLQLRGDSNNYINTRVDVTGSNLPANMTIVKSAVDVGRVDTGAFVRSNDFFIIQLDRSGGTDLTKLRFNVTGLPIAGNDATGGLEFGAVRLVEAGGRPGHGGTFPIQGADPQAGTNVSISADIMPTAYAARYVISSTAGVAIDEGPMQVSEGLLYRFAAPLVVPNQPFRLRVIGSNATGQQVEWASARLYNPTPYRLTIQTKDGAVRRDALFELIIKVESASARGSFNASLVLPAGFIAEQTTWLFNLSPGSATTLNVLIKAPLIRETLSTHPFVVEIAPAGSLADVHEYLQTIVVK